MANSNEMGMLNSISLLEQSEIQAARPVRRFMARNDAFNLSDALFIRNYRLSKQLVMEMVEIVSPFMPRSPKAYSLDVTTKILIALNFLGTGSYQYPVGNNINMAVSQSSVSRAITQFVDALNTPSIFKTWVKFPSNFHELRKIRSEFYESYGFPGVIGCLDCTHVAICPPSTTSALYEERTYVNRKKYHSINVQLICDANLKIINVNALFPGSTHDSFIWNNSAVEAVVRSIYRNGHSGFHVIGDSGYSLRPWLMTPIMNCEPNSPEDRYNTVFRKTRALIERCNGVLKMRFRCLLKHRVLHYSPEKATKIINACVILHNMCISRNIPEPQEVEDSELDLGLMDTLEINHQVTVRNRDLEDGKLHQRRIIQNYFA